MKCQREYLDLRKDDHGNGEKYIMTSFFV